MVNNSEYRLLFYSFYEQAVTKFIMLMNSGNIDLGAAFSEEKDERQRD